MNYYNEIKNIIEKREISEKVRRLQSNSDTLKSYYNIGKLLIEAQGGEARAKYGNGLIKEWSKKLVEKYGKGYDYTNLSRMRKLYLTFENVGALPQHLTWTNLSIILPIKEETKMVYYINICIKQNLSSRQLKEKIKNKEY